MAFCTVQEIRDANDKLSSETDVPDSDIEARIAAAERKVKADLGKVISPDEIDAIGAESNVIRELTIAKTAERTLVKKFGAKRKADDVSDIEYFRKEYKDLLDQVLKGEVPIDIPDTSGAADVTVVKNYPKLSGASKHKKSTRKYPRKGVPDFYPDGVQTDYTDDV